MLLFRGLLIENELWNNIDRPFHILLGLKEEVKVVFLRVDKVFCKPLRVHQAEERRGPLTSGVSEEPAFKRAG